MVKSIVVPASLMATALLGGCSISIDTEKKQCTSAEDCTKLNPDQPLTCESGLCVAVENAECRTSAACDDGKICNSETSKCVNSATCAKDDDCAKYSGLSGYVCEGNSCEKPECTKASDCGGAGFMCTAGRCIDPVWGCVGEPDDRTSTDDKATYKVKVLSFLSRGPIPGLQVRTCIAATSDPECKLGAGPGNANHDETTGFITVTDVPPRTPLRLRITPPESTGLLPVDFYSQLTPLGMTEERAEVLLVPGGLIDNLNSAFEAQGVKVAQDAMGGLTLGNLVARIFDCQQKPAKGAKITYESQSAETLTYYLDETLGTPHTDWPSTDSAGVGGVVNIKVNQPSDITIKAADDVSFTFSTQFQPKVLTYINFYPRNYNRAP